MRARVTKSTGSWNTVRTSSGQLLQCKIKGRFRVKGIKSTNPVAVGDWVEVDIQEEGINFITQIHDRSNYIIRKSINLSKRVQILACNIDQILIFVTLKDPLTTMGFVDRILCNAEAYHITPILVFNKLDLLDKKGKEDLLIWKYTYQKVGYSCMEMSLYEKRGVEEVKEIMKGKTNMLAGHSGTGKSSLLNYLDADLAIKTAEISDYHRQGKHNNDFC